MSKATNLICPKFEFPISARENRRKRNFPETGSPPPPTTKENAQARQTHIRSKHYIISKQGTVVPHITPTVLISTGCHKRP
jgi:hypothetical protein